MFLRQFQVALVFLLFPRYWKYTIVPGDCNIFKCLCKGDYDHLFRLFLFSLRHMVCHVLHTKFKIRETFVTQILFSKCDGFFPGTATRVLDIYIYMYI